MWKSMSTRTSKEEETYTKQKKSPCISQQGVCNHGFGKSERFSPVSFIKFLVKSSRIVMASVIVTTDQHKKLIGDGNCTRALWII